MAARVADRPGGSLAGSTRLRQTTAPPRARLARTSSSAWGREQRHVLGGAAPGLPSVSPLAGPESDLHHHHSLPESRRRSGVRRLQVATKVDHTIAGVVA